MLTLLFLRNIGHKYEMKGKELFFETWCYLSFGVREEVTLAKIEMSDVLMSDVLYKSDLLYLQLTYQHDFILFFRHLSSVLGNKFDHGAEAIMPTIFNLIPNSAKVMATSGVVAVRLIIRVSIYQKRIVLEFLNMRCFWWNMSAAAMKIRLSA